MDEHRVNRPLRGSWQCLCVLETPVWRRGPCQTSVVCRVDNGRDYGLGYVGEECRGGGTADRARVLFSRLLYEVFESLAHISSDMSHTKR